MHNKYLIVGDIHGWDCVLKSALEYAENNGYTMIQVGDLTDSFSRSIEQQKRCLEIAKDASYNHIFLRGNHDLSYMFPSLYRCSGYSPIKKEIFQPIYGQINFSNYFYTEGLFVSHAGLSEKHINPYIDYQYRQKNKSDLFRWMLGQIEDPDSPIYEASYEMGGNIECGGIYWCRPHSFENPFCDTTQVFGHTPSKKAFYDSEKDYWNIDCIEYGTRELLIYEGGEFHVLSYEEYAK